MSDIMDELGHKPVTIYLIRKASPFEKAQYEKWEKKKMTDIEFAKEVAETVWGMPSEDPTRGPYWEEYLVQEINSWDGFGRTVEAMEKRKWHLEINRIETAWLERRVEFVASINDGATSQGHKFISFPQNIIENNLIKATHQAALDVVKEEL